MEVKGKLLVKLPIESGTKKDGNTWEKQTFVIEISEPNSKYQQKLAISAFGETSESLKSCNIDDIITVKINLESREYNGKYYTNVNASSIEVHGKKSEVKQPINPQPLNTADTDDNLPF